ncbi:MAG: acetolactate synthase small subunit [Proteobacteria bacterium]|nr:acetolactate synthase small subunit [Pseudomonadota bacterium]MCH9757717.1 acetolactate synthase small subunit [Pseudomonadota bacterium]
MRRILSILIENQPGALSRVANLFSARGYNIESLTVAPTEDSTLSRMTVVTHGNDATTEQITKQVNKLIEVYKVIDITEEKHVERELMIVKVRAAGEGREEIKRLVDIFRAVIINVTPKTYIIQITGNQQKLNSFITALGNSAILEIARTGACGLTRLDK